MQGIQAGFFSTARYQDGTPVTNVAAWNEFGTQGRRPTPERPFMRQANHRMRPELLEIIKDRVDPVTLKVDLTTANTIGMKMQSEIANSIVNLKDPPNAPYTIARKGSSNPLIDTGKMVNSVAYEVFR